MDTSFEGFRRNDYIVVLITAVTIFALQLVISINWNKYGVFDQYNVIFDSDPNRMKTYFAHGWSSGDFNHPLLSYFFSIPSRVISFILSELGLANEQEPVREALALLIAPLMSSIKSISFFLIFRVLGLALIEAFLLSLISALSFSSLVFGSTPSSYVVSGAGLSLATLFALLSVSQQSNSNKVGFILSGLFSVGTTASNVIHYGWMTWMSRVGPVKKSIPEFFRSVVLAGVMLGATLSLTFILAFFVHEETDSSRILVSSEFIGKYKQDFSDHVSSAIRFPEFLARSYIPSTPLQKDNVLALKSGSPIEFELTYNGVEFGIGSFALWLLGVTILCGALVSYRLGGLWRWAGPASLASVVTVGAVFTWFGTNTFLYSLYWQVPGVILLAAWYGLLTKNTRYGRSILTVLLILLAAGDVYVMSEINTAIAQS